MKSFKCTPVFGNKQNVKVDFMWPTIQDLNSVDQVRSMKLAAISWKKWQTQPSGIGAIQLHFSVDKSGTLDSPVFTAVGQTATGLTRTPVGDTIYQIKAKTDRWSVFQMHFCDEQGKEHGTLVAHPEYGSWQTVEL